MISRNQQLLCVWCGPAVILLMGGGFLYSGIWPPPHPTDTADQIRAFYGHDPTTVRLGLASMMAGMGLLLPWGASIATQTRRIATSSSALTMVQMAACGIAAMIGLATFVSWGVAAFRPDEAPADLTRALSDVGWFFFDFTWSPLFVWYVAVALAILGDQSGTPVYPRWAAYLSLWVALLSVPGGAIIFFKTGPLAFNGLFGIWIPLAVFFVWIVALTQLTVKAINREAAGV